MACNSAPHTRRYARAHALPNIHGEGHNDRVVGVFNRRLYVETSVLQRFDKLTVCGQAYTADVAPRLRIVDARCRCADTANWSEHGATARTRASFQGHVHPATSDTVPEGLMHVVLMERGMASQSEYSLS